jgi:hypothetical protein
MFSTAHHVLQDEMTSDEILLEALASKSRVRERLSRVIRQQADLKQPHVPRGSLPGLPGEPGAFESPCLFQEIGPLN